MKVMFSRSDDGRLCSWRAELNEVEEIVNVHVAAWRDGDPTPVGPALDAMLARWWSSGRRGGSQGPRSGSEERRRSGVRGGSAGPDLD